MRIFKVIFEVIVVVIKQRYAFNVYKCDMAASYCVFFRITWIPF